MREAVDVSRHVAEGRMRTTCVQIKSQAQGTSTMLNKFINTPLWPSVDTRAQTWAFPCDIQSVNIKTLAWHVSMGRHERWHQWCEWGWDQCGLWVIETIFWFYFKWQWGKNLRWMQNTGVQCSFCYVFLGVKYYYLHVCKSCLQHFQGQHHFLISIYNYGPLATSLQLLCHWQCWQRVGDRLHCCCHRAAAIINNWGRGNDCNQNV